MIGKYLVIGAVLAGVIAFFLPFLVMQGPSPTGEGKTTYSFSVMKMMQGVEGLKDVVAEQAPEAKAVDTPELKDMEEAFDKMKTVLLIPFVPTGLFLLFVLIGMKRFGRGLGVLSLLVGLLGLGLWAIVNAAASEAGDGGEVALGTGFTVLLI
ncbi:MAG: hypothetical protein KDK70_17330, partial [Myxococcales bacterium]|nr:hypothetical protein [Myxococcales bacterium]